jgi:hypothetical protein
MISFSPPFVLSADIRYWPKADIGFSAAVSRVNACAFAVDCNASKQRRSSSGDPDHDAKIA